jgi:hypothetical protein
MGSRYRNESWYEIPEKATGIEKVTREKIQ